MRSGEQSACNKRARKWSAQLSYPADLDRFDDAAQAAAVARNRFFSTGVSPLALARRGLCDQKLPPAGRRAR
jgi:hypothetical protein